ncbi:phosphate/phosphite/phosphonate ABC transporter substrate-binding protein [Roseinatronobacter bogoriensis]|uniref:Phosphate/phosphite/phosphonate ABC transporter substrate-binding protein n=1 Tax=Roseinatronobacter bogoriensis subsp. barguzinensis TaxID=441209 RepID=A0A2K8K5V3_9RHOB|nr:MULTISPECIES: phosphate/phosphite/phosphonate ABC transporter substrate-binding protein [Rhodobaca]ATX64834.1 phosphate/phosphite/phosphonate ABC transporter substrate-binding protein [Rhodobaca barguzinensis]MBB4208626.1 phosphonate transport system substrate-binding protein [Rhodobaca bogoriensis DSM 18756]TDW38106.1 phosphonate transport system substrate-binding protein [Rhodobaca barguzinensis]TDY69724.1 phosphonate transport system substrate-binding protein [Rhodobaca bogoriensis DSM 18
MTARLLSTVALGVALALPAGAFNLDPRFTDADGDLIADIPTDESEWVDPAVLVFAYTPVEDPAVYEDVWAEFLDHMSDVTGKPIQFFPVQSNAAQLEAMRAGRLHVAAVNTGGNPIAVACAGFRPFAMMAAEDGSFGYEMEIITYPGSGIETLEDLDGRQLAFTSETSNSGFKAPQALLESEFGLLVDENYTPAFSGGHDNSILGVANQDYDAAAIANSVLTRMEARGVVSRDDLVTIYKSDTFPTSGYGTVYNLHPELQEKIQDAFFSFEWEGTGLEREFGAQNESQFIPITFQENWAVIRQIDAAMGVTYTCN